MHLHRHSSSILLLGASTKAAPYLLVGVPTIFFSSNYLCIWIFIGTFFLLLQEACWILMILNVLLLASNLLHPCLSYHCFLSYLHFNIYPFQNITYSTDHRGSPITCEGCRDLTGFFGRSFLPLDEAIASWAVFVIVSGSDGRTETLAFGAR